MLDRAEAGAGIHEPAHEVAAEASASLVEGDGDDARGQDELVAGGAQRGTGAGPVGVGVRDGGGASAITVRRSAG